jgi:hypothetical protein
VWVGGRAGRKGGRRAGAEPERRRRGRGSVRGRRSRAQGQGSSGAAADGRAGGGTVPPDARWGERHAGNTAHAGALCVADAVKLLRLDPRHLNGLLHELDHKLAVVFRRLLGQEPRACKRADPRQSAPSVSSRVSRPPRPRRVSSQPPAAPAPRGTPRRGPAGIATHVGAPGGVMKVWRTLARIVPSSRTIPTPSLLALPSRPIANMAATHAPRSPLSLATKPGWTGWKQIRIGFFVRKQKTRDHLGI